MSGSEPSDAIRVVNALLTQIDLIKRFVTTKLKSKFVSFSRHKNVIILTTSNITGKEVRHANTKCAGAIDLAFVDR